MKKRIIEVMIAGILFLVAGMGVSVHAQAPNPAPTSILAGQTSLSVTTSSARVVLPSTNTSSRAITIFNKGGADAYFKFGLSTVTATTSDTFIAAGTYLTVWNADLATHLASITASSTATLVIYQGNGPIQFGQIGGGGSGGGAVDSFNGRVGIVSAQSGDYSFSLISGTATAAQLPVGKSVADPGTGVLESLLPIQTNTGTSKTFATADLQRETRRTNSGTAMTDTFPAAAASGMTNGTRITLVNADSTASDTITAGSGTTISGNATYVAPPSRSIAFVYDAPNTTWRPTLNTGTTVLGPGSSVINHVAVFNDATGKVLADVGYALGEAAAANLGGRIDSDISNNLTIGPSGVTAGVYGDSTHVPVVTISDDGTVSAASTVAVAGGGGGNANFGAPEDNIAGHAVCVETDALPNQVDCGAPPALSTSTIDITGARSITATEFNNQDPVRIKATATITLPQSNGTDPLNNGWQPYQNTGNFVPTFAINAADCIKVSGDSACRTTGASYAGTANYSYIVSSNGSGEIYIQPIAPTGSSATAANPTATIGAAAVNGSASTYMRSDAAPALPSTLPALNGSLLTNLNASNLASGTAPAATMPAFSGDASSSAGATALTLATVNSNTGACGDATHVCQVTLDGKGRTTAASAVAITGGGSGCATGTTTQLLKGDGAGGCSGTNLSGDVTTSGAQATTLATVNSNTGSCGDATHVCQVTLDGKGRATAAAAVAITAGSGTVTTLTAGTGITMSSGATCTTTCTVKAPTGDRILIVNNFYWARRFSTVSGAAIGNGTIHWQPWVPDQDMTINNPGTRVITGGGAGTNCSIAIYDGSGNYLADTGSISVASSGTVITQAFSSGSVSVAKGSAYRWGINCDNGTVTVTSSSNGNSLNGYIYGSASSSTLTSGSTIVNVAYTTTAAYASGWSSSGYTLTEAAGTTSNEPEIFFKLISTP